MPGSKATKAIDETELRAPEKTEGSYQAAVGTCFPYCYSFTKFT